MSTASFARAIAEAFGLDPGADRRQDDRRAGAGGPAAAQRRPAHAAARRPDSPGVMRPLAEALADFRAEVAAGDVWADPMAG